MEFKNLCAENKLRFVEAATLLIGIKARTPVVNVTTAVRMCQQEIIKYDLHVKAYIQNIKECTGPAEVLSTLNLNVGENMKALKNSIDELERLAVQHDRENDKLRLLSEVESHRKQLKNNQLTLRRANLACQMVIDQNNKEQLFEGTSKKLRQRVRGDKESLARQSSAITDNLSAISNMMADQVKQNEDILQTLVSSSGTIGETHEEYKSMGSVIHQSHKLLTKYNRRELTDKVLIFLALAFFFACVLYVLKKRLF